MSISIRWPFRLFNRLKHQQTAVKRVPQSNGSDLCASQVGDNLNLASAGPIGSYACASNGNANIYQANQMAVSRNQFEGYDGAASGLNRQDIGSNLQGGIAGTLSHDGSYKFYKWDTAQGCMTEVVLSTPLSVRLARSFNAFLRSWRLG